MMLLVGAKLGLDGEAVDAEAMKAVFDGLGQLHPLCRTFSFEIEVELDVKSCNKSCRGQCPDMNVVTFDNARQRFDVFFNVLDRDVARYSLKQGLRRIADQRNCRLEDDQGDHERNRRVEVKPVLPTAEPNNES